jgi:HTH-type transcriptional regulator, glycine betaine synthesis regulator
MDGQPAERFVEAWGSLGVLWGINRSMARIHALLVLADEPIDLDTLSQRLNISRGNASMSLKELRHWGVIQRVHRADDRRDFYVVESDVWTMFFRIARERKKREFDPALHSLRDLLSEGATEKNPKVHARLEAMESLLSTADRFMGRFLESEEKSKGLLGFLSSIVS